MSSPVDPLSTFTIVRPNESQKTEYLKAQFVPWNRGLTWEDFVKIDEYASKEAWSTNGGEQAWVLVKRDDPEGEIYSGCGTYRRYAFMKSKDTDEIKRVVTYGIQSVVTPVQHHKNGYARHLLKLLHYVIGSPDALPPFPEAWGAAPAELDSQARRDIPYATAAFLWSDVGPTFYEKCTIGEKLPGYVMEEEKNRALVWKVLPPTAEGAGGKDEWEWIHETDVPDLQTKLSEIAQQQIKGSQISDRALVRTDPANEGTLSFIPLRAYAENALDPEVRKNHPFGLRRKDGDTVVISTPGLGAIYKRMCITLHHNLKPQHLPSLLAKMDELAPARNSTEGQIWGLQPESELARSFKSLEGREADLHTREGMGAHLLAVASYLPGGERVDFQDSQIWNWC